MYSDTCDLHWTTVEPAFVNKTPEDNLIKKRLEQILAEGLFLEFDVVQPWTPHFNLQLTGPISNSTRQIRKFPHC